MSDRLNRLLAEAKPESEDKIKELGVAALKKIGIKKVAKPQITRSYHYGAELHFHVGNIDGKPAWLEVTLDYDGGDTRIALRMRGYSRSETLVHGKKQIHDLAKLMKSLV